MTVRAEINLVAKDLASGAVKALHSSLNGLGDATRVIGQISKEAFSILKAAIENSAAAGNVSSQAIMGGFEDVQRAVQSVVDVFIKDMAPTIIPMIKLFADLAKQTAEWANKSGFAKTVAKGLVDVILVLGTATVELFTTVANGYAKLLDVYLQIQAILGNDEQVIALQKQITAVTAWSKNWTEKSQAVVDRLALLEASNKQASATEIAELAARSSAYKKNAEEKDKTANKAAQEEAKRSQESAVRYAKMQAEARADDDKTRQRIEENDRKRSESYYRYLATKEQGRQDDLKKELRIQERYQKSYDHFYEDLNEKASIYEDHQQKIAEIQTAFAESVGDTFAAAILEGKNLGKAFEKLIEGMIQQLVALAAKAAVLGVINLLTGGAGGFLGGFLGGFKEGGIVPAMAGGGVVTGFGQGDRVHLLAEPGEVVINKARTSQPGIKATANDINEGMDPAAAAAKNGFGSAASPLQVTFAYRGSGDSLVDEIMKKITFKVMHQDAFFPSSGLVK